MAGEFDIPSLEQIDEIKDTTLLILYDPDSPDTVKHKKDSGVNVKSYTKGFTKVLWTGPLFVVSTPTSLDGGEKFSDWDMIIIEFNFNSDVAIGGGTPFTQLESLLGNLDGWSDTGKIRYHPIDDTTFEISIKTIAAGNISRIIGVSL